MATVMILEIILDYREPVDGNTRSYILQSVEITVNRPIDEVR